MEKLVIFCESYPQIKNALYVATHNGDNHSIVLVIPGHHDLLKFFNAVNERVFHNKIDIIYFERYQRRMAKAGKIAKALYLLPNIIGERRHLKLIYARHFAEMKGAQVYFFSRDWASYSFYLLKRLSEGNRLVYIADPACDRMQVDKSAPRTIVDMVELVVIKLIFGCDITMGKRFHTRFPSMPDKFIEEAVGRVIGPDERDEMTKGFDLSQFRIFGSGKYSAIYFDEDLIGSGYLRDRDTFIRELSQVFDILTKHFPEREIARKYHPGSNTDRTMIKIGDVLEDFIPAELLYDENTSVYLSTLSLSIANVERGLAISLIDLISFKSDETKEQSRQYLKQNSHSEILFPKSLDEFERIVIDVKGQTT